MPSLLSKYRSKKRDSSADDGSSSHKKGTSDASYDSSVLSPGSSSGRGLNSPFMGDKEHMSPPRVSQATPALNSPRQPQRQQGGVTLGAPTVQGSQGNLTQGPPFQVPPAQSQALGHPQGHPQGQGLNAKKSFDRPPALSRPPQQQPGQQLGAQQPGRARAPQTPTQAVPVKDRLERTSPAKDRQDPWAEWQIRRACPTARFGHSANNVAAREGELIIMGGIRDMDILDDLWVIDTTSLTGFQVKSEGPYVGPRVGHAALTLGNAYIMIGGDTKIKETDPLDNNLYLLNTSTFKWTVTEPVGPRPSGRYGHSICCIDVRIYIFGGQVDDLFFDDMWMFDLQNLRPPNARWVQIRPSTPPPPPRTNHTVVSFDGKMYLFGGANGDLWYSDTWCFDPSDQSWTQLECTGYVPAPCQGHAATIVGDVMYVFGGMSSQGLLIGQLFALKLTTCKWYTFQNLGSGPSPRSGHSLTAYEEDKILVWGGTDQSNTAYVLDVSRISYPPDDEIDNSFESQGEALVASHETNTTGPNKRNSIIADTAETKQVTHEKSTPAARNSVIYSRTSWSPRRSFNPSQFESAEDVRQQDIPRANLDDSYNSYDQSDNFNRVDVTPGVSEPGFTSTTAPKSLASELDDTHLASAPTQPSHVTQVKDSTAEPQSPGMLKGAIAGAVGAAGAIGAGLFGKQMHKDHSTTSLRDEMPGSWAHTRVESSGSEDTERDQLESRDSQTQKPDMQVPTQEHSAFAPPSQMLQQQHHQQHSLADEESPFHSPTPQAQSSFEAEPSRPFEQVNPSSDSLRDTYSAPFTVQTASTRGFQSPEQLKPREVNLSSELVDDQPATQSLASTSAGESSTKGHGVQFEPQPSFVQRPGALNGPSDPFASHATSNGSPSAFRTIENDSASSVTTGAIAAGAAAGAGAFAGSRETSGHSAHSSRSLHDAAPTTSTAGVLSNTPTQPAQSTHGKQQDIDSTLRELQSEFARVKNDMQKQAEEASKHIQELEKENSALKASGANSNVNFGSPAGAALQDQGVNSRGIDYMQKYTSAQRDLLSIQEQHTTLQHSHEQAQTELAQHRDENEYLRGTMDQHMQVITRVNSSLEQARETAQTYKEEKDALQAENAALKQQLDELREAQVNSTTDLNRDLAQVLNHWNGYTERTASYAASRSVPSSSDSHYPELYEKQKAAHSETQQQLDSAYAELAELRQQLDAQPNVHSIKESHEQTLRGLQEEHDSRLHEVHTSNSELQKKYEELEASYNGSLEHFENQRRALELARDELNRVNHTNVKLQDELSDVRMQLQDPDASTASTTSNRHAEVVVRGLKARVMILEEERDELRQKVDKLREAALTQNF